jgi:broad specificity phosphatase PhoE
MTARKIMVIRHGEKPPKTGPPPAGVREDGSEHDQALIVRGWQRAGALAQFFGEPWDPAIERPAYLYSPPPHGSDGDHGRPNQTITPLSEKLGVPLDVSFVLDDERKLVADALARGGVVAISWEHKRIPRIANAILGDETTAPQEWPDERFDVVWLFDLQPGGGYRFSQRPQLLLSGDRADVISTKG